MLPDPTQSKPRRWTFMVYLAGDNNLEGNALRDLQEMQAVGSTAELAIVAQVDTRGQGGAQRFYLRRGGDLQADLAQSLPETNTGDPATLLDFVAWAAADYPAERYALVLWNHGSGWKDEDLYQMAQRLGAGDLASSGATSRAASGKAGRSLFRTSLEQMVVEGADPAKRAILFDDTSADFLDNVELKNVLEQAAQALGRPVDLLGFDACLMNMLEVAYQVRQFCGVAVGSQELEPGDGWPYEAILSGLASQPQMETGELGRLVVEAYLSYYRQRYPATPVTQSAVCMADLEGLASRVDALGRELQQAAGEHRGMRQVFAALRSTQSFSDRDYIDLAHFCHNLAQSDPASPPGQAAAAVLDYLQGAASPLLANGVNGKKLQNASGLSIYLPARSLSPLYSRLDFAHLGGWEGFLKAFIQG